MDRLLEHIIRDFYTIDEAYSPKIIKQLIDKFKQELEDFNMDPIGDRTLESYIKRFDQLKNSPKIKEKDLLKWSISDLVRLITSTPSSADDVVNEDDEYIMNSDTPVFENDYIQIFHAGNQAQCTTLRTFDSNNDRGESWCIGRGSYSSYRFQERRREPSFYYIIDKEKFNEAQGQSNHTDFDKSFFVVQIRSNGNYVYTPRSNSPNESSEMDWEGLTNTFPILAQQITPDVLRYIPITPNEKMMGKYKNEKMGIREFLKLPFDTKKQYLVLRNGNSLFPQISNDDFVTRVLPKLPKLSEFISVTHGIIDSDTLLKHLESFTNQHSKSIIQNLRNLDTDILYDPVISWDVKKILIKYASDKFTEPREFSYLSKDEKVILVIVVVDELNNSNYNPITIITENDVYRDIKITSRLEKYVEGIDFSKIDEDYLFTLVLNNYLPLSAVTNILDVIKAGNNEDFTYSESEGKEYIINTSEAAAYNIDNNVLTTVPFDSPEIATLLGDGFKRTMLQAFTGQNIGPTKNMGDLTRIIQTATVEERVITNDNVNDGRPVILITDPNDTNNKVFLIPTEATYINGPNLTNHVFDPEGRLRTYSTSLSSFIYEQYFDYLRSTNQVIEDANLNILLSNSRYGNGGMFKRLFIKSNPPLSPNSNLALKYWEPNNEHYIINKTDPSESHKVSKKTGKRVKANISNNLYATIMGEAPAAPTTPETPAAPAAPGAPQRGRPAGGARVYDLTTLPPLQDHPTEATAEDTITGYGFNWNGLSDRVKYALHGHATPRNIYGSGGVTRRRRQLDGNAQVTHFWTVDTEATCAMYLIQRGENGVVTPLAINLVIQPGNEHWLITANNATRMTTANIGTAIQNLNESIDIKKYILKETIYQQNKETMKISELQALVKEAIQEVLSENRAENIADNERQDAQLLKIKSMEDPKEKQQAIKAWKQKNDDILWRNIFNKEAQEMYGKPFQDLEDWQRDEVYAKIEFRDSFQTENQPERSPETPDRDTETLPDPGTKPGRTTRRRKVGNPDVDPKPKAYLEEAEKEIMKMITQRFKAEKNA